MKKVFKLFTMAFISMFALVLGVNAKDVADATELNDCLATESVCTLTADINADAVVPADKTVTLDLNGNDLTAVNGDAIYVTKGATLTIKGEGNVIATKTDYAAVFNDGTMTIDGGTFKRDVAGNTNKWYVILNHGVMTINDATVTIDNEDQITSGSHPSLVDNGYSNFASSNPRQGYVAGTNHENPSLTVNGGTFTGGLNTIKNDDNSVLEINGGTFKNTVQVSLMNWNMATINGGTFETPTGNDKTNIFVGNSGTDSVNKGILVINGGTFNAENIVEGSVVTPIEINGGEFNYTVSFVNNSTERQSKNDNLVTDGNIEVIGGTFADDTVKPEEGYTKYEVAEGEYVVAKTITFDTKTEDVSIMNHKTLTLKLDELIIKYGEFKVADEKIAKVENGVITALKEGKTTITVKFDGKEKTYNLTVVKNPETGDSAMIFMVLGLIGLVGAAVTTNKLRHN